MKFSMSVQVKRSFLIVLPLLFTSATDDKWTMFIYMQSKNTQTATWRQIISRRVKRLNNLVSLPTWKLFSLMTLWSATQTWVMQRIEPRRTWKRIPRVREIGNMKLYWLGCQLLLEFKLLALEISRKEYKQCCKNQIETQIVTMNSLMILVIYEIKLLIFWMFQFINSQIRHVFLS